MYGETGEPKDGNTKIAGQGHCRTENMECGKELDMQNETDKQILSTLNQDNFQNSSGGKKAAEDDEMGLFSQGFMDRMREMVSEQFGEEAAERFMVQNKDMIKEEDDYLNYLSLGKKVIWEDYKIYFPMENGDLSVIYENQRVAKIKFKKLSIQYKDGLAYIAEEILGDISDMQVRRIIKNIEKGV